MILGIGIDISEIGRIRDSHQKYGDRFIERILLPAEIDYCLKHKDPAPSLAARFAAKEAALKALGLGLGGMPMYDIEVVRDGLGPPRLVLHGAAAEVAREAGVRRWLVTMSHTSTLAQATVVAL